MIIADILNSPPKTILFHICFESYRNHLAEAFMNFLWCEFYSDLIIYLAGITIFVLRVFFFGGFKEKKTLLLMHERISEVLRLGSNRIFVMWIKILFNSFSFAICLDMFTIRKLMIKINSNKITFKVSNNNPEVLLNKMSDQK